LKQALRQLSQLLTKHDQETTHLIGEISADLTQARRQAELASFEPEDPATTDQESTTKMEKVLARAEKIFASAKSVISDAAGIQSEKQEQARTALLAEIATETQTLG